MKLFRILIVFLAPWCLASTSRAEAPPQARELSVSQDGFAARYYAPQPGSEAQAAVLMVGGSDGGYPSARAARDLAEAGHPVLALAYFSGFFGKIDGLPDRLERVPLEYAYGALDWLRAELGGNRPVAVMGESRGAEFALLIGTRRPDIAGIIAFSPTSLTWPAVGDMSGRVPAWTEGGKPVPFVDLAVDDPAGQFLAGLSDPARAGRAAIPIERARAAILLISSRSDAIWPAARMANQLEERRRSARPERPALNLQFDDASHLLMGPGPGVVRFTQGSFTVHFGGSEEGTLRARTVAWKAAKAFLTDLSTPR